MSSCLFSDYLMLDFIVNLEFDYNKHKAGLKYEAEHMQH